MSDETQRHRRSHIGCWTCKKRRRKCDETRPVCLVCLQKNLICEGYGPRLRWNVGVASRGHWTGAPARDPDNVPPRRAKGRRRDLLKALCLRTSQSAGAAPPPSCLSGHQEHLHFTDPSNELTENSTLLTDAQARHNVEAHAIASPVVPFSTPTAPSILRRDPLFEEFLSSGSRYLHATTIENESLLPEWRSLCDRSDTLYRVCLAYQAYLRHGPDRAFYEYYSEALSNYRADLDHPLRTTDEALLNAALLLCTIGLLQGTPWTLHIYGFQRLLDERAAISPLDDTEPAFVQAIEVMGVMDLHRFVIGRQTPALGIWRSYRLGQLVTLTDTTDSVQPVAGIPRSLLDLLSKPDTELTERDLMLWPGCEGGYLQCHLWDAYRFATMLDLRRRISKSGAIATREPVTDCYVPPPRNVLLTRALSSIDAVYIGQERAGRNDPLVLNAMLFPLFLVSFEVLSSDDFADRHKLVAGWFDKLITNDPFVNARQAWELVQRVSAKLRTGLTCSLEGEAQTAGVEVALL